MSHTRGPWLINLDEPSHIRIRSESQLKHEHSVAIVPKGRDADARLICAAPIMYQALIACAPLLKLHDSGPWRDALDLIERAIAIITKETKK